MNFEKRLVNFVSRIDKGEWVLYICERFLDFACMFEKEVIELFLLGSGIVIMFCLF